MPKTYTPSQMIVYLEKLKNTTDKFPKVVEPILKDSIDELSSATPVDTGLTAQSWDYRIKRNKKGNTEIDWINTRVNNRWFSVVPMLMYGHATRNGGYVQGRDFVTPIINKYKRIMADTVWEEVRKV